MLNVVFACLFNIFSYPHLQDSTSRVVIGKIELEGNARTKNVILYRELLFKEGDTLSSGELVKKLERSRLNLLNTSLFNFVTASSSQADSSHTNIRFVFSEAWYTWPSPIFELVDRNFNEWLDKRDLRRINYGFYLTQRNVRGRNETLNLGFRGGYTESYTVQYSIPYISKNQRSGIGIGYSYSRNHETVYNTTNNKLLYFSDPEQFTRRQFNVSFLYSYRKNFYVTHNIRFGYKNFAVSDTILKLNPDYLPRSLSNIRYFYLSYFVKKDVRDLKAYPLKGYYLDAEIIKAGLGGTSASLDEWYVTTNAKKFWELRDRIYYAAAVTNKFSAVDRQSYSNQVALGYDDLLRGYEYYVINGQYYGLFQSNFKFTLLQTKILKLKIIPLEKFRTIPNTVYLNLFGDAGYVSDRKYPSTNPLANHVLYSYGLGMDYVTYYSTVLRVDYSINKFGENGFFIHFTIPI